VRSTFRNHLYPLDHPRLHGLGQLDPCTYADSKLSDPVIGQALNAWSSQFTSSDFSTGITSGGTVHPGLFALGADEHTPAAQASKAAREFIDALAADHRQRLGHPLDSRVWRAWMNPEIYLNRYGLRLEELESSDVERALNLLQASLSPSGYQKVRELMRINEFLGHLVALPQNTQRVQLQHQPLR
jgi:hypothetical protein